VTILRAFRLVAEVFVVAVILVAIFVLFGQRAVQLRATSPSGDRVAVLHRLGENDPVPYGDQVAVAPRLAPFPQAWLGDPVFQGICGSPQALVWRSDSELLVRCTRIQRVALQRRSIDGITIVYEESTPGR